MDSKLCSSGERGTDGMYVDVHVHVCVAQPMIVGGWSLLECYYYY